MSKRASDCSRFLYAIRSIKITGRYDTGDAIIDESGTDSHKTVLYLFL